MKNFTLLCSAILTMLMWAPGHSQVIVGTQNGTTSTVPISSCYEFSYSQQLVYQSEINASGDITSISFYYEDGSYSNSTDWTVYLGHTTKTEFTSYTDWVSFADLTQVYSGVVTFPAEESQMVITFDSPFSYNNTDNLVLAVDENQSDYDCSIYFGKTEYYGVDRSIYYRSDSTNPDPTSPPEGYSTENFINNIVLGGIQQSCPPPTNLVVNAVALNTADISWTANGTETNWEVRYGSPGFDITDPSVYQTKSVNTSASTTLTGLQPSTFYEFYVKAQCGGAGGSDDSTISGPQPFKTACQEGNIPFFEGFENGQATYEVIGCWTQEYVNGYQSWRASDQQNDYDQIPRSGEWSAYMENYQQNEQQQTWMFYPLELTGGITYELSFYARQNRDDGVATIEAAYGTSDQASAMINTIFSEVAVYNGDYQKSNGNFTPASTGTYYIGIKGNVSRADFQYASVFLTIDDISVEVTQETCSSPSDLLAANITDQSADISWTPQGSANQWELAYGETGFNVEANEGTNITIDTDPETTLEGLDYNTSYAVYVRSICDEGTSSWTNVYSFTTDCQEGSIPFFEGFENGQLQNQDIECWTQENENGSYKWEANNLITNYNRSPRSGEWNANLFSFQQNNQQTWMFYPLELVGGTTYELAFYARQNSSDETTTVQAAFGDSDQASAMTHTIFSETTVYNGDYQKFNGYFTSVSTGTYYIGIKGNISNDDNRFISLDDISVEVTDGCFAPTDLTVNATMDTSADISWAEGGIETDWIVKYSDSPNFDPETEGLSKSVSGLPNTELSNLSPNTTYEFYVKADCGSGNQSDFVGPVEFTTGCIGSTSLSFLGTGEFQNSIVTPTQGTPETTYEFKVVYTNEAGALPPYGFPRVVLDYEGNGSFTNTNDRSVILSPADPNDNDTTDGKVYFGSISQLPSGTNWQAWAQVQTDDCTTEIGPFDAPDVLITPDLEIFANDIVFDNPNPGVSSPLQITATIHNNSDLPAENFVAHLENQYETTAVYPDIIVDHLEPHQSIDVVWNIITPAEPSWNPMEVFIDHTDVIIESNELNNRALRPFINGDYNLPGAINIQTSVSPSVVQLPSGYDKVSVSGHAYYTDTAVQLQDSTVAGATVTFINPITGNQVQTHTNGNGYFSFKTYRGSQPGVYTAPVEVTDFTITGETPITWELIQGPCAIDLRAEINPSNESILVGESVSGEIVVTNTGCAAVEVETLLEMNQTGGLPFIGDVTVPALEPGESYTYNFTTQFDTEGTYYITALADAGDVIQESSENNNLGNMTIKVNPPLPDIKPAGSGALGSQYLCSVSSSQSFGIRNIGYVPTGIFENTIEVYFEGLLEETYTETVQNIAPGQSASVSIPFEYQQTGSYSFVLTCDVPLPDGTVVELLETNNIGNYAIDIIECRPDLFVSSCDLVVDPVDLQIPGTVTYTAQVRNGGNGPALGPVEFQFTLSNGEVYPLVHNQDILPGEQVTFTTPAPAISSGGTSLTATVDPSNLIDDTNLNNNSSIDELCWEFEPVARCGYDFWNGTYHENESTQLAVGLKVEHLYRASEVKMRFEVSGPGITGWAQLGDATVQNVTNCHGCPYTAALSIPFVFNQTGVYTFKMTSDPDNEYAECNEGNNVLIEEVTVKNKPDMRILSQHINPTLLNPDPGQPIFLDISYENIGYSNINDEMDLKVLIDDQEHAVIHNVPGLIKNSTNTIAVPVSYSSEIVGLHVIRAIIDSNHDVNDGNWLNNEATRSFIVGEAANLFFDDFYVSNETPEVGETITIEALIENDGEIDVSADVLFSYVSAVGDTLAIGTKPVNLLSGGNQTVSIPWTVLESPTTIVGEIINTSELEFDYTDNFASTQLNSFNVSLVATPACEEQYLGTLTAEAANGTAPYTYNWSNGFMGETIEAQPGTYSVNVVDAMGKQAVVTGTIEEDPDCVIQSCSLSAVSFNIPSSCDPDTGMYTTTVVVAYENEPTQGSITVNGTDYSITGSPQSFEVDFASGPVVYTISFTEDTNCNLMIPTGITLDECGEDGYIYLNDSDGWTPGNPNSDVNFTSSDNITVIEGTASFTGDIGVNDITVNSGATLNVESVLTINGDITNNGEMVFKSTATSDGELAAVPSGSTITGNVTVERYTSDHRAYRFVSSAVTTSNSIHANWQEGATSATDNPNPGYGTHITGTNIDQQNGFDETTTGNPSMFTLNIGNQAFEAVVNTNSNTLNTGDGYLLYVRGDRSIDLNSNDSHGSTVLRATGALHTGDMTQSLGNMNSGDFVAVVNPYQSTIDVNSVLAASQNLNANYAYVYDSTIGTIGAYVTVDLTDNNGAGGQYIQPGQAVQVAAGDDGTTSIIYNETAKAPGNHNTTFNNNSNDYAKITAKLFTAENYAGGGSLHDSFSILFAAEFSNNLNNADAVKPFNFTENMGIGTADAAYSVERRELPVEGESLALFSTNYKHQAYTLVLSASSFEGTTPYLVDRYTESETELEVGENLYDFTIDQGIVESIAPDRFYIHFGQETLSVDQPIVDYGVELYPNPSKAGETFYITTGNLTVEPINVKVYDLLGKLIYTAKEQAQNHKISVQTEHPLSSGIYFVQISQNDRQATKRLIIR